MSFCESPKDAIKCNADTAKQEQGPEHKGNNVICAVYGVQTVCAVDVQDGEQAAQVVNTDGGDNKDNGHVVTSGGLGSGIQWVTFTKSGKYSSLNHTSKSSSLHAI